ncbi:MAG: rhodanese-like domain-containing protein [candidate division Zixibacteria bacterium]|nr:rhodanese-like domain-containing protein [candidate division Zixibacteria bacterium]
MNMLRQAFVLLFFASILGFGVNSFHPKAIPLVGEYRELTEGSEPIVPPSASAGDPLFIAINEARSDYEAGSSLFIDARDPSEFECGTIPGSINMPFEYLPEDSLEQYMDSVLSGAAKEQGLIVFCSGEECDVSLHLARNLQAFGYTGVKIFFGGAREWENFELEIERRVDCAE